MRGERPIGSTEHAEDDVPVLDVAQDAEVEHHDEQEKHPLALFDATLDLPFFGTVGGIPLEFALEPVKGIKAQADEPDG